MSESPPTEPETGATDPDTSASRDQGEPEGQKWLSGIVSLIGLWIAASPFVYAPGDATLWNNVVVGGAIFLLAGYNYYRIVTEHPTSTGVMTLVALLGVWVVAAPFLFEGQIAIDAFEAISEGLVWSNVVSGILTAGISAYIAYAAGRTVRTGTPAEPR